MGHSRHSDGHNAQRNTPAIGQQRRTGLRGWSHDGIDQERDG